MDPAKYPVSRTDPRIHVGLPVRLQFGWKESEELKASIVDISERGLHVRCRAPLRQGLEVKAIFDYAPDDAKVYSVVWVREAQSSEPAFEIGLELKV